MRLVFAVAVVMGCALARAEIKVIDFESLTPGSYLATAGSPVTIDGVRFNWIGYGDYQRVMDWNGDNVIVDTSEGNLLGAEVWWQLVDGSAFLFDQMTIGSRLNPGDGLWAIRVRANLSGGGSVTHEYYPLTPEQTLTAATLGVSGLNLTSMYVNLVSEGGAFYYDDILLVVPEPGAAVCLLLSLAALAGGRRGRSSVR
jgi:hypothetical protein